MDCVRETKSMRRWQSEQIKLGEQKKLNTKYEKTKLGQKKEKTETEVIFLRLSLRCKMRRREMENQGYGEASENRATESEKN